MSHFNGIPLENIKSSSIAAFGYSEKLGTLVLKFNSGGVYVYGEVPKEVVDAGFRAEGQSAGRFLYSDIKGKYPCVRVS